jgi:hypothetical protein
MRTVPILFTLLVLLAASRAADAQPDIRLSPPVITEGQTVSLHASGFTPNGHILAHLVRPDGTEYPEMAFTANGSGEVSHLITIILILTGTYEVQMIDLASKTVAVSRFIVVEGTVPPPGTWEDALAVLELEGVWQGAVSRASPPDSRTVIVALSGGEIGAVVGTVAYPSLSCGGELWLVGFAKGSAYLGEHITYGEQRCSDGIVTVRPSKDRALEVQRRDAARFSGVPASGMLPHRR